MELSVFVIGIITSLTEGAKRMGMPSKFAWLLAVALGVVSGFVFPLGTSDIPSQVMGLAYGLAASGLYEGLKNGNKAIRAAQSKVQ